MNKLVSDIIEFIDYDLWKEIYLYPEEDEEAREFILTIEDMISSYIEDNCR